VVAFSLDAHLGENLQPRLDARLDGVDEGPVKIEQEGARIFELREFAQRRPRTTMNATTATMNAPARPRAINTSPPEPVPAPDGIGVGAGVDIVEPTVNEYTPRSTAASSAETAVHFTVYGPFASAGSCAIIECASSWLTVPVATCVPVELSTTIELPVGVSSSSNVAFSV
jgi:hypothetical protein